MTLTPALIRSAKAVVSICKRIDWDTLKATQCDIVHLHFQSIETVQDANHTLLEMAAGDCDLRRAIVSRIERAFRMICPPVAPSEAAGKVSVLLSNSEVEKLLNDLDAPKDAANFADLCVRGWVLYREIYREALEIRRCEAHLYDPLPPLPQEDIPFWLGPAADLWIGVPIQLVFAEPIVRLCQRIAENNTGVTALSFEPGEEESLRLHHRLWTECKPWSCRVPVDDFSHPICHRLQTILDAFIPKLRKVVSVILDQVEKDKNAEVTEASLVPVTTVQRTEMIEHKHERDERISASATQGGDASIEVAGDINSAPQSNNKAPQTASSGDTGAAGQFCGETIAAMFPEPIDQAKPTPVTAVPPSEKAAHEQVGRSELAKSDTARATVSRDLNPVAIEIGPVWIVTVDGKKIDQLVPRRALQALAVMDRPAGLPLTVSSSEFVKLTHRSSNDDSNNMYRNARALEKLHLKTECVDPGVYTIREYSITIRPPLDTQQIREYLEKQKPRVRPKKSPATG